MNGATWTCFSETEPEDYEQAECDHLFEVLQATGVPYGETQPIEFEGNTAHYIGLHVTDAVWVAIIHRHSGNDEDDEIIVLTREVE